MRRIIISGIIASVFGLVASQNLQAQGTTYLSNLDQPSVGSASVGSDSWLAQGFLTGTNAGGYMLSSIQTALTNASGNPGGFTAMIYNVAAVVGGAPPGSSLGTLNGSLNPVTAGVYTYSPASSLTLSPGTLYYIVLTSGTAVADGAYEWSFTSTHAPPLSDGWGADNFVLSSSDGLNWTVLVSDPALFAITATGLPVPEPSTLGLLALGGFLLVWHRRKAKTF